RLNHLGISEFFSILFILYESVSILKNMYLCGLPVPRKLKDRIGSLLDTMTDELNVKGGSK
ncbi:phage holin family protein, partial [Clostridioides difficile]|nr:phage holin family protein [Clostridioides difficile]MDE3615940.1 phage holin family protein [Clostridioides difficile]MDV9214112.1 phage holin family protein [Clostridioides difficile]MDV9232570.1 phage holin family protein [Clostridioides difficile]